MTEHTSSEFREHLNLLMAAFSQQQDLKLWDAPLKTTNGSHNSDELVRGMYERIVFLEQQQREQDLKIGHLQQQLQANRGYEARYADGVLLWKITEFHSKIDAMKTNPNIMFYSNECYTAPHGYKFCCRINISPKVKDYFGLHVHLMQSDNDFHLDWPFKGRIKLSMIHMKNLAESQTDTIMSKPEILAFHRPQSVISPRGFGYLEYASLTDIYRRGFVVDDTLVIKIQLNIV
jgi:TNF receptor-associated factor 6